MKIMPSLRAFSRRKATWFALLIGLLTAGASWWLLPPEPRRSLSLPGSKYLVFSPDMSFAAESIGHFQKQPENENNENESKWVGHTTLWDLNTGQVVFSLPMNDYDPYRHEAISPDNQNFVEFSKGKARFHKIPSGEAWESKIQFIHDPRGKAISELAFDAKGRILVVIISQHLEVFMQDFFDQEKDGENLPKENNLNPFFQEGVVRDLFSGEELGILPVDLEFRFFFPGGVIGFDPEKGKCWVRNLPGGELEGEIMKIPDWDFFFIDFTNGFKNRLVSTDCKTLVTTEYNTFSIAISRIWDVPSSQFRFLDLPFFHGISAMSPNGRFLVLKVQRQNNLHPWLQWLLRRKSWITSDEWILYDLKNGVEVSSLGEQLNRARFSVDGKSIALYCDPWLHIYDFPLRRPWTKIVGYASFTAATMWLGCWLLGYLFCLTRSLLRKRIPTLPPR